MRTEDYIVRGLLAGIVGVALGSAGCSSGSDPAEDDGTGSSATTGGATAGGTGGSAASTSGGTLPSGGQMPTGGVATGGASTGGSPSTGGTGGAVTIGGTGGASTGGVATGGTETGGVATGGTETGGAATGGQPATGGAEPTGGAATGGSSGAGGSTGDPLDCSAPMPTSSGTTHCGSYRTGRAGDLSWELWSNSYSGSACITYYDVPAFSASWNNNGDFLARLGIEWGGRAISQLGEVTAEFTYTRTGSAGGFSYIGVYGWATSPCVEYYIIDDSFNGMPFSPWSMQERGSATIDGGVYKFYSGSFGGTGGSRCGTPFTQHWSIRQEGRQCGVITVTKHFEEWANVGMNMDNILEAKILMEAGGGQGSAEFPIANVKSSL